MSGGEWPGRDWLRETVGDWALPLPAPPFSQAVRQVVDLFGFAPATVAREVVEKTGSRLIGRMLDLRFGPTEVRLVLTAFRLLKPPVGILVGQLGDVLVDARDVRWHGAEVARLRIVARNVHIQPGPTTILVTAPVRFEAWLDQQTVDGIVARTTGRVVVELTDEGTARARLPQRPGWGHVDLVPAVEGRTLVLRPSAVAFGAADRARRLVKMLPPLRFTLPEGLEGSHLSKVEVSEGHLVVHGLVDEWREPLTPGQLNQLVRRIERFAGTVLQIPRSPGASA
jgi:hypothetical protein